MTFRFTSFSPCWTGRPNPAVNKRTTSFAQSPLTSTLAILLTLRLIIASVISLSAIDAFAQLEPPQSGATIDKTYTVAQRTKVPTSCVAFDRGDVFVLLDREELKQKAQKEALGQRKDIEDLLDIVDEGSSGCAEVAHAQAIGKAYLFEEALQKGRAVVLSRAEKKPVPAVLIRYSGNESFGGHVFYYIPNQSAFHTRIWWMR